MAPELVFNVLDAEGNIIINDFSSSISIIARDGQANQVTGTTHVIVKGGSATFGDLKFFGDPGSYGELFEATCSSIGEPLMDANGYILPGEVRLQNG